MITVGRVLVLICLLMGGASYTEAQSTLEVRDIILRYDGEHELGTFAAVVCNPAIVPARNFEIALEANGTSVTIVGDLLNQGCMHYFDAAATFDVFGIAAGDTVTVTASIDEQTFTSDVVVDNLNALGTRSNVEMYESCLQTGSHAECYDLMFDSPAPHEVKVQAGAYFVIAPIDHERIASRYLLDLEQCAVSVGDYLGLEQPPLVMRRLLVTDGGESGSYASVDGITTFGSDPTFRQHLVDNWQKWQFLYDGGCSDPHEMTHIFVSETVIPGWLNEGLATFMESPERVNYHTSFPTSCLFDENKFVSYNSGGREEIPFLNLMNDQYDSSVPGIHYYFTASCFWVYLDEHYGHEAIQQIAQGLVANRDSAFRGCPVDTRPDVYFIRDIVTPVLGEDITPVLQQMFGIDDVLYTGCER